MDGQNNDDVAQENNNKQLVVCGYNTIHKMARQFIREETYNLEHCPNFPSFHFTFAGNAAYEKKYGGRLEA